MNSAEKLHLAMMEINKSLPTVEEAIKNIHENMKAIMEYVPVSDPQKIQGYTAEQWQEIIDGGYLCEFNSQSFDDKNDYFDSRLGELKEIPKNDGAMFETFDGNIPHSWSFCRPAQLKGVMRPWFGGECPVDDDAIVFVKYNKSHNVIRAGHLKWGHKRDLDTDQMQITAYIEV